ncbi:MAG: hypothetical protein U1F27_17055 [Turneriella sp.]
MASSSGQRGPLLVDVAPFDIEVQLFERLLPGGRPAVSIVVQNQLVFG